jgi:hypothetical protein
MGRAGRYTLSVMAWVAAFAGWSSLIGLVVAAATGDEPRTISTGGSALMQVLGPLVPTLVALWFNDWARDGFPTREQKRAAAQREVPVVLQQPVHVTAVPATVPAAPLPEEPPAGNEPLLAPRAGVPLRPAKRPDLPVVQAHPLGVPASKETAATDGRFPVAPLLRD